MNSRHIGSKQSRLVGIPYWQASVIGLLGLTAPVATSHAHPSPAAEGSWPKRSNPSCVQLPHSRRQWSPCPKGTCAVVEPSDILPGTHVTSTPKQSPTLGQSRRPSFKSQSPKPRWVSFLADPPLLKLNSTSLCLFDHQGSLSPSPKP